jgi:cytochrome c oxidase cbb3-type subunit 3
LIEERDPHTGYLTTGHEWNGITELNRPVPKAIWLFLLSTFVFSLVWWILMPSWPLGDTYTPGVLGVDQRERVANDLEQAAYKRAEALDGIAALPFDRIRADRRLMKFVRETGRTMFGDNCAVCHGASGRGGPGFPSLADRAWLWGGDPETIAETLRVGINDNHPDTRVSQMLAFGRDGLLDRAAVLDVVHYVQSLGRTDGDAEDDAEDDGRSQSLVEGQGIFAENCASCHGEKGRGLAEVGAPNLTDENWIYGGDLQSVFASVYYGRQGQMPAWQARFTEAERKIMTLYVLELADDRNGHGE